jgi:hypothetical protein
LTLKVEREKWRPRLRKSKREMEIQRKENEKEKQQCLKGEELGLLGVELHSEKTCQIKK